MEKDGCGEGEDKPSEGGSEAENEGAKWATRIVTKIADMTAGVMRKKEQGTKEM